MKVVMLKPEDNIFHMSFTFFTALAPLSHCNSVCLSVTRVDQSKTVQVKITKFSPSTAWKF